MNKCSHKPDTYCDGTYDSCDKCPIYQNDEQKEKVMELEKAKVIAEDLTSLLAPVCEKIKVAGSIRRRKTQVGDIELLVIPKYVAGVDQLERDRGTDDSRDIGLSSQQAREQNLWTQKQAAGSHQWYWGGHLFYR